MKKITFQVAKNMIRENPSCTVEHDWWDYEPRVANINIEDEDVILIAENNVGGIAYNEDDKFYVKSNGSLVMKSMDDGDCIIKFL